MQKVFFSLFAVIFAATTIMAQGTKKPASPRDSVSVTTAGGTTITINYSRPSVKGRTIGKDVEPKDGTVWRAGANKTTLFEVSKDVKINGQALPAGKYGLYILTNKEDWTIIFNKKWDQWGTEYSQAEDALRVTVKDTKADPFSEQLTYTISPEGKVALLWGEHKVEFAVE